jgi:hypothetical protein
MRAVKDINYLIFLVVLPAIVLIYFLIQEAQIAGMFGFPLDDAWIFWVFAKNLAAGHGLSFNPGQPVLGTTSILWVLILAASYVVTHNAVLISKFWGVILYLAAVLVTYRICLFHTSKKTTALIAVLTFALAPPVVFGALSGMEIPLATLLFCLTLLFHLKERGKNQKVFLGPIFGALCFIARPELIVFYPLLLLYDYLFADKKNRKTGLWPANGRFLRKGITFALFLCPPFALSYLLTGSFLPNTFAAKTLDSGLVWAIQNGNLHELAISLSLNPFVWGGSMLVALVSLNVFWAFFWSKGLVLSLLNRKTLIYPAVFVAVPIARGIIAPVSNPILGWHRYVSFLFPLLAVFFVMGWERVDVRTKRKISSISLRKKLVWVAGFCGLLTLVFYLHPLVDKGAIYRFFSGYYFPSVQDKSGWLNFCDFKFIIWFIVAFIIAASLLGTARFSKRLSAGSKVLYLLLIAGIVLQAGFLVNRAERCALSVKNINQMQVHLGQWMSRNIPAGSLVAINDAGAIKFFGNRECLDLEGLVSEEIVPYKILGADSYIAYLNDHRPDYFMIFPTWYPPLVRFLGLKRGTFYQVQLEDNVAVGGAGYAIVAKPDWQFFDSTLQNTGLLKIKPYIPKKSIKRRWYDAQERQGLFPNWRVCQLKGREAERMGDLDRAERFYRKALSYDPQHHEFYMQMAKFYDKRGARAQAALAFRKSVQYQLFPPP